MLAGLAGADRDKRLLLSLTKNENFGKIILSTPTLPISIQSSF
jgi:hypothetical protein